MICSTDVYYELPFRDSDFFELGKLTPTFSFSLTITECHNHRAQSTKGIDEKQSCINR